MRKYFALVFVIILSLFLAKGLNFSTQAVNSKSSVVEGNRAIIKFRPGTPLNVQENIIKNIGVLRKDKLKLADTFLLTIPLGKTSDLINKFAKDKNIEYAEEDYVAKSLETPMILIFQSSGDLIKLMHPLLGIRLTDQDRLI